MKEIKILIQQLRNYPNNFFVVPTINPDDEFQPTKFTYGLTVCNHLGEEQGFIETGGKEGVVIQ